MLPLLFRALALVAVGIVSARGVFLLLRKMVAMLAGTAFLLTLAYGVIQAAERPLEIEAIEVDGNTRTSNSLVFNYMGLRPGDAASPDSIVASVERLRASGLFRSVEYEARAGSERGRIVLHLRVEEKSIEFRLGAGYQDLSGWYLIPAELRLDNRLGRGEEARVQARLGYRVAGIYALYEEPRFGDGKNRWGVSFSGTGAQRVYFVDGVEYRHDVQRSALEAHIGRALTPSFVVEIGGGIEGVDADSSAEAGEDDEVRGIERGDELPYEDLPRAIASNLGEEERSTLRLDLTRDSRTPGLVTGTPSSGIWGRVRAAGTFPSEGKAYGALSADLRAYRSIGSVALAARARGGATGEAAPWYDRFYVGGLYTVRGYPSQSLAEPEGETRFWSASVELRAPISGRSPNPRLAGVLFLDAGDAWSDDASVTLNDVAVGAGWGLRLRVPWIGWLGVDVARPLSESRAHEAFHANASIGMTF
jgi:outer membrane protein assembly factor BamA